MQPSYSLKNVYKDLADLKTKSPVTQFSCFFFLYFKKFHLFFLKETPRSPSSYYAIFLLSPRSLQDLLLWCDTLIVVDIKHIFSIMFTMQNLSKLHQTFLSLYARSWIKKKNSKKASLLLKKQTQNISLSTPKSFLKMMHIIHCLNLFKELGINLVTRTLF